MPRQSRTSALHRLLGAALSVCLVLQPLLVPLHLALEDHTHGHADAGSALAAHAHPHAHPHVHPHAPAGDLPGEDPEDDSHPKHPAADHLGPQHDQAPAPSSTDFDAPTALPVGDPGVWDVVATRRPIERAYRVRERPPPRASARPRAPPATV
jgi:hypothetical protein